MKSTKPLQLTPEQRRNIIDKGERLRQLLEAPGWMDFKDIFEKSVSYERDIDNLDTGDSSFTRIGQEAKVRQMVVKRLRIIFDNMVQLIEAGQNNLAILQKLETSPETLFRKMQKDAGFDVGEEPPASETSQME